MHGGEFQGLIATTTPAAGTARTTAAPVGVGLVARERGVVGEEAQVQRGARDVVVARGAEQPPGVARLEQRQLIGVRPRISAERVQQRAPLLGVHARPRAAVEGRAGGGDARGRPRPFRRARPRRPTRHADRGSRSRRPLLRGGASPRRSGGRRCRHDVSEAERPWTVASRRCGLSEIGHTQRGGPPSIRDLGPAVARCAHVDGLEVPVLTGIAAERVRRERAHGARVGEDDDVLADERRQRARSGAPPSAPRLDRQRRMAQPPLIGSPAPSWIVAKRSTSSSRSRASRAAIRRRRGRRVIAGRMASWLCSTRPHDRREEVVEARVGVRAVEPRKRRPRPAPRPSRSRHRWSRGAPARRRTAEPGANLGRGGPSLPRRRGPSARGHPRRRRPRHGAGDGRGSRPVELDDHLDLDGEAERQRRAPMAEPRVARRGRRGCRPAGPRRRR